METRAIAKTLQEALFRSGSIKLSSPPAVMAEHAPLPALPAVAEPTHDAPEPAEGASSSLSPPSTIQAPPSQVSTAPVARHEPPSAAPKPKRQRTSAGGAESKARPRPKGGLGLVVNALLESVNRMRAKEGEGQVGADELVGTVGDYLGRLEGQAEVGAGASGGAGGREGDKEEWRRAKRAYWTDLMGNATNLKYMTHNEVLELYKDTHPPLPPGMTIDRPFVDHCVRIVMQASTAQNYHGPYEILRAFDLAEWVDAAGGAALFQFHPKGVTKLGRECSPLSGDEMVPAQVGPSAFKLAPIGPGAKGVIPDEEPTVPRSADTRLYQVIGHKAKCSDTYHPPQNVTDWATDPEQSCPDQFITHHIDIDKLSPNEQSELMYDAFTHLPKYVDSHYHYRLLDMAKLDGFKASRNGVPTLPGYSGRTEFKPEADSAGINTPYIYSSPSGARSVFAVHLEDNSLASVNTLVQGAPKMWQTISPVHGPPVTAELMSRLGKDNLKGHHPSCSQAVRQPHMMFPPALAKGVGATPTYIVQHAGEMVYVAPDTLHCGINWGGNTAVAINLEGKGARGIGCCCGVDKDALHGANPLFRV